MFLLILHYLAGLLWAHESIQRLPLGYQSKALPVHEVQGFISPEVFFSDYVIPGLPVVFKGAVRDFPAHQVWSDEYFLSRKESETWMVAYELGKKETREGGQDPIPFSEYIKRYKEEDLYCVTGLPRFLRQDLPIFQPLNCNFILESLMDDLVMWFSSGGTKSVWHYDDYENLNCLIRGSKELILANRSDMEFGHFEDGFSKVDVDAVDLSAYPGFGEMVFYNASIEAGDCLFIPSFWSHAVRSWDRNIAINAWWEIYKTPIKCAPPMSLSWDSVTMITDSDVGKVGEEEFKDTENGRSMAGNVRTSVWVAKQMRQNGVLCSDDFIEIMLDDLDEDDDYHDEELWGGVFRLIDVNGDGLLQPSEVDLFNSDEILESFISSIRSKSLDLQASEEL